ncbi:MAG TPA: IS630 family transposase [Armatimonadetes bacterium]|nr:IS630 family transposase [Armatimonadota bacterium]
MEFMELVLGLPTGIRQIGKIRARVEQLGQHQFSPPDQFRPATLAISLLSTPHIARLPWRQQWVIPPQANAEFVCAMEDVLDVYTRPYDPARPVVCLDELSKQRVAETRVPIPTEPGQPERVDYEYERRGTANLFLTGEPLAGHRHVTVTKHRTAVDFAHEVRDLLEVRYPHAEKVVLVMDNLNTHKPAALYEAFEPAVARALLERLEIHHTPKHGSWLNMAEIEFSILLRGGRLGTGP